MHNMSNLETEPWATATENKNRKLRLQFVQAHYKWTIEEWKNVAFSDGS